MKLQKRTLSLALGLSIAGLAAGAEAQLTPLPASSPPPPSQMAPPQAQPARSWYEEPPARIYTAISYSMAVPLASAGEMANSFSPLGFSIDVRYFPRQIRDQIFSAGLSFGWQTFKNETSDVIELGNISVQGKQLRYVNTMPLLAGAHAYLPGSRRVRPFAGFNLGTYYMHRRLDIGLYVIDDHTWHFGIAPEVGVALRVGHLLPVLIVRYNHAFSSGGSGDLSFLNFNIGLAWN